MMGADGGEDENALWEWPCSSVFAVMPRASNLVAISKERVVCHTLRPVARRGTLPSDRGIRQRTHAGVMGAGEHYSNRGMRSVKCEAAVGENLSRTHVR